MRFARLSPLLLLILAALLAGCGGDQIAADEVPADPPSLTIPIDPDAAPGASTADQDDTSDDEDADADETSTTDPATSGGTSSGSTSSGSTGGTTATPAPTTAAPTATAPPEDTGGATADEGLDQFCADNPGAC